MNAILMTQKLSDVSPERRRADELVRLIRKLRWMGMEDEAKRMQMQLGCLPSSQEGCVVAEQASTD